MDPRFRLRRVEVRRQEGRRRFRVLIGITTVAALGVGGWAATGSTLFDLDRIVVVGAVHTAPDEARFASGLRLGQRLLDVDDGVAARGMQALPWVEHASVSRSWSGEVRIRVVERRPVAFTVSQAGNAALVDGGGRVLDWVDVPSPDLAALAGLPPAGPAGSSLTPAGMATLTVAVALPPELRGRAAGVSPAGGTQVDNVAALPEVDINLSFDGRPSESVVRLGPPEDLDKKFDAVRTVLARVDLHDLAVLDVRRPDSPVLTRHQAADKVSTPRVG
jgi:cell division protein FtsQ